MARIAITGAAGNVGREAIEAFPDHDVQAFTHSETDDIESEVLEIEDREAFSSALSGFDVLVHLAANPAFDAEWDELSGPNVEGVYNAFEAARENDLDRVVFASSNHAVNMKNVADAERPESTLETPEAVRPDDVPEPDSYYGVTKVAGEAMGDYYAARHGLEVVSLRIGWLLAREELTEAVADGDGEHERYARAMWLSPEDCRRAVAAAATTPLEGHVVAHAISANADRFLSLTETAIDLDYHPDDDAAAVLDSE